MKKLLLLICVLACTKSLAQVDQVNSDFRTGTQTGWFKLATFDLSTTSACCNSVTVNGEIDYVNTWQSYNANVYLRFRVHKTAGSDVGSWYYELNGSSGEYLKFKKLSTYLYELWGKSGSNYGHFKIDLGITQEAPFSITAHSTPILVTDTGQEDVSLKGAWHLVNGGLHIGRVENVSGYDLAVAGKMISEEVVVKLESEWPDYVFAPDYNLTDLSEIESYIKENQHLPGIPSAQEVEENGVVLGEMNALLLEKVEELTLHIIQLEKRIKELEK